MICWLYFDALGSEDCSGCPLKIPPLYGLWLTKGIHTTGLTPSSTRVSKTCRPSEIIDRNTGQSSLPYLCIYPDVSGDSTLDCNPALVLYRFFGPASQLFDECSLLHCFPRAERWSDTQEDIELVYLETVSIVHLGTLPSNYSPRPFNSRLSESDDKLSSAFFFLAQAVRKLYIKHFK